MKYLSIILGTAIVVICTLYIYTQLPRHFSDKFRSNFIDGCSEESTYSSCLCALDELEKSYSQSEVQKVFDEMAATNVTPVRIYEIADKCVR